METLTKEVPIFVVGEQEFLDRSEAERYEKELQARLGCIYHRVSYEPDLAEGRGYYKSMILAVKNKASFSGVQNALIQYLVEKVGKPVEMVMGVSPIDNWILYEGQTFEEIEELDAFLSKTVSMGFGSFRHTLIPPLMFIDDSGKEIPMDIISQEIC